MRITIERLRTGIVVVAVVLVVAIATFLWFARYERRRLVSDLPAKLGIQIQESADSFTLSKSNKGHTIFTIHAAKAIQYKGGGHATLHDVSISLYGAKGDRTDRIHGGEFDYDPKTGIATAAGEVDIDLEAPAGSKQSSPGGAERGQQAPDVESNGAEAGGGASKGTIHVKTSGLTFNRETGTASTHALVEFQMPQGAGHATGASYDSQEGVLVLDSAVQLDSSSDGKALSVQAGHAQILRDTRQAFLLNPVVDYQAEKTSSDEAVVYFRTDGSLEHVDAQGHVHIVTDQGQELKAPKTTVFFDAHSQPLHAEVTSGLFFVSDDKVHHMHGDAVEAKLQFGEAATLRHVQLLTAVSFVDQQVSLPDDPNGSTTRELRAQQVDVDFATQPDPLAKGTLRSAVQRVLATGSATVVLHTISAKHPQQNTTIGADTLLASFGSGNTITAVNGTGHTSILDVAADGATHTSTGDNLVLGFAPLKGQRKQGAKEATLPATEIRSALQQGNVTITQTPAVGVKADTTMHITAQRAEYHAGDQALHLDGNPRLNDGSLDLTADSMEYQRLSGNATAKGNVKATYLQRAGDAAATATASGHGSLALGGQGPAHIVSDTATLTRAAAASKGSTGSTNAGAGDAIFRGHARLWQGTNSISAPVIELSRTKQSLRAHGDPASPGDEHVNALLATPANAQHPGSVDRIQSRELTYSDAGRQAIFSGGVAAQGTAGTIHSDEAVVYLAPAASPGDSSVRQSPPENEPGAKEGSLGQTSTHPSQIERIVATGHIVLDQPGRKATGDKLIYNSEDGNFTLTGTASTPPQLVDSIHGTVTGASLIFNSRDDSVTVSGGQSRASTDTRVSK